MAITAVLKCAFAYMPYYILPFIKELEKRLTSLFTNLSTAYVSII